MKISQMRSYAEALTIAETWAQPPFDNDTMMAVRALLQLPDGEKEKAIVDRFGYDLSFGTAGMRAIMDVGTARINDYTIAHVSQAVASVLRAGISTALNDRTRVVIGYDGRKDSAKFAQIAAREFLAAGIEVHAFDRIVPTPLVPFAVRRLKAACGVMITSSHNAAPYNGYKVYAANGAQILSPFDTDVMANMKSLPLTPTTSTAMAKLTTLDESILRAYVDWAVNEVDFSPRDKRDLKIVFTPLHGAAGAMMNAVFFKAGFKNFFSVPQQYEPHPLFPTVKAPNPENKDSLDMAREMAVRENADLILATDGDGDRVGVAYHKDDTYISLTGNQIGTLFLYYALSKIKEKGEVLSQAIVLSSVVSTPLTRAICAKFGCQHFETLTGFKNMGNKADAICKENPSARHVLSFEEAFGVTLGDSRDKDGLISNLTAAHIGSDGGIEFWLEKMYRDCGYAAEDAVEAEFPGATGIAAMNALVDKLRKNPLTNLVGAPISTVRDFMNETPAQNMLIYTNTNGDWLALRPSGTEPKIKAYVGVRANGYGEALVKESADRLAKLCSLARELLR